MMIVALPLYSEALGRRIGIVDYMTEHHLRDALHYHLRDLDAEEIDRMALGRLGATWVGRLDPALPLTEAVRRHPELLARVRPTAALQPAFGLPGAVWAPVDVVVG